MYDKTLIKDDFGQHYTIQTYVNPCIRGNLSPKEFNDHHLARQFVKRLQVPTGYWQGLMQDIGSVGGPMTSEADMYCAVCERIVTGQIKVFAVNPPSISSDAPQKRAIRTSDKVYHFVPSVEQLLNKTETKHFTGLEEARAFLLGLNPDTEQLKGMAAALSIPVTAKAGSTEISQAISESLAAGDTVVMVDNITSATPPTKLDEVVAAGGVGNKKADLGPHESEEPAKHKFSVKLTNEAGQVYKDVPFKVTLSDKSTAEVKSGNATFEKEQLPAGTCSVKFEGFYQTIEKWIQERNR